MRVSASLTVLVVSSHEKNGEGGRHTCWAQKADKQRGGVGLKTAELGRIPRLLVEDIYDSVMALGSNRC